MKTRIINRLIGLVILMTSCIAAQSQDQIEVPGDNFSLEGALELFKESSSPKEFEKMLNDPDTKVNNLDLNGDGYIDYIKVLDMQDGNVHAFVLQAVIAKKQYQDIAVITLEKQADGKAILQITGDEDIYGVETIIEPTREVRTYAGAMSSNVYINVWSWPIVRYVYGPHYSVWVSPWGWHHWPHWWHTWHPVGYYDYYHYWRPYRRYYSHCYTARIIHAHRIYRPHRTTSVIVHNRYNTRITRYRSNHIDRNGRYRSGDGRNSSVRTRSSVRYNENGRIVSDNRRNSRTATNVRSRQSSTDSRQRSSATNERRASSTRSSGDTRRYSTDDRDARDTRSTTGRSSGNSNVQRSTENQRYSRSSERRSAGSSNMRQSSENNSIDRSSGRSYSNSSSQRSYGNSGIQRSSSGRSSGSSGIQRSSSSRRSSGIQRSSGSSRRSSGNSSIGRSSSRSSDGRSSSSSGRSSRGSSSRSRR